MKTANERLAEARVALGYDRKAEFAERVGIERSTYDKMEKGPHKPSADNLERIVLRFPNLNLTWLLTGIGRMLLEGGTVAEPLTSGEATVEYANQLASNGLLREIIDNQKEQITDLRGMVVTLKEELGKFGSSPDAAGGWLGPLAPRGRQLVHANY